LRGKLGLRNGERRRERRERNQNREFEGREIEEREECNLVMNFHKPLIESRALI